MSRIGRLAISLPVDVELDTSADMINVKGPKGSLSLKLVPGINVVRSDNVLSVSRVDDQKINKSNHGLYRTLINNMVIGVSQGFSKKLEINGVGYKVNVSGSDLQLSVGYSHIVNFKIPEGISINIDQNIINVSGIDKQQVGQVAANIRAIKKPEPYKGKGIKYIDERIIRKSGKSGKEK
ncbi:MAG: 50S ribosomal protein L6 [Patescibacteria group bacterium]|jgi:large subunit ribosomal protein L6|nr:50S ribosomal protein L6 [Patescibacteria group bacterium]